MTREFLDNKRARFVPPMRLYIFISFIFFLLVGKTVQDRDRGVIKFSKSGEGVTRIKTQDDPVRNETEEFLKTWQDSNELDGITGIPQTDSLEAEVNKSDTLKFWTLSFPYNNSEIMRLKGRELSNDLIDSLLVAKSQEISFFNRQTLKNFLRASWGDRSFDQGVRKGFIKYVSIFMFILMPVFAMFLYLLHIRSKRNFYEYLIFSVHIHTALFTFLSCVLILGIFLDDDSALKLVLAGMVVYFVVSLKASFGQSYPKVLIKTLVLGIFYLLTLAFCLLLSLILGAFFA